MLRSSVAALLLVGAAIVSAPAGAAPVLPQSAPEVSTNIVPVQGWGERCHWLRERIREIEARLDYAPPWERRHLERRLWRTREEFRESCRRWY